MGVSFRALKESDYQNIGPLVTSNTSVDAYDAISNIMYGSFDSAGIEKSLAPMHTRKVIKLVAPTFNHVLGRSNCTLLATMLDIRASVWDEIVKLKTIYNLDTESFVSVDVAEDGGNYLYGGQIAEHFIKKLNIQDELLNCLYRSFGAFLKSGVDPRDVVEISKSKSDESIQLVDGYYASFEEDVLNSSIKRGKTIEDIRENYANVIFSGRDSRYSYLRNMNPDKSGLYGMLNYYIVVIPEEMRPKIDNQEHKLTKHYTQVLNANLKLQGSISNPHPKIVAGCYASLEWSVRKLQYKNQGTASDVKPDDLALLERIKSKKGQIRMRNLGKRQDYSGRAVVCINPYLPLDVIKVPKSILPKLLEYHVLPYLAENIKKNNETIGTEDHLANVYDRLRFGDLNNPEVREEMLRIINEQGILDRVPMVLGRQPTLHKQSLQGFHIEMSDLQAIEVNPLVCPAFNMDFDGDQAHLEVPLTPGAVREVNDLVMTTQNLFLPKTGECTTEPRQEMLYGLWMCTKNEYKIGSVVKAYDSLEAIRQDVMMNRVKVWDTVSCIGIGSIIAGDAAFMACFPKGDVVPRPASPTSELRDGSGNMYVREITKKTITPYINHLLRLKSDGTFLHQIGTKRASTEKFVGAINALVELGFKVARLYPPNISLIIEDKPIPEYDNAINKFHESLEEINLYYNLGMETADNYKLAFSESLSKMNDIREKYVIEKLGDENGYVKLSVSGARGSTSNLVQAFSIKGQVKKNDTESFDALLEHSYSSQLTPMEHFVAAYGGRQGQIDKSLKTGDTGYAMRKMWHATQGESITCLDCGTTDGLRINKKDLIVFSDKDDAAAIEKDVQSIFEHALVGRYTAANTSLIDEDAANEIAQRENKSVQTILRHYTLPINTLITEERARELAADKNVKGITLRSPVTCKNPCCAKCYGIEWSTHKPAVVGTPVGIIAAQSIGEPGTQLTLKQFQKGGVAGKADVTSAFDKVDKYIHVADLEAANKKGTYPGYDPIAWDTGEVKTESASDINMLKVSIGDNKKSILVPRGIKLKTHVEKGAGLSYVHGDYNIREIIKYSGIRAAQTYLIFKLYALYRSEIKIKMVHFEMLVADMTRYMIVETDRKDLMVGQYATAQELYRGNVDGTRYIPRLIGVKDLTNASHEGLDSIIMEGHVEGLSRACLLGMTDTMTKPINRMVLGQSILNGSNLPSYIHNRKEVI